MEFHDVNIASGLWVKVRYEAVQTLLMDHERTPHPNEKKSNAIKILVKVLGVLTHHKETFSNVAVAVTNLNIGILQADLGAMELATESFNECIHLLKESKLTSEGIIPAICANIQLGRVFMRVYSYGEADDSLKQAEDLYVKFTEDIELDPVYTMTIMGIKEIEGDLSAKSILEKLHILTFSYFVRLYRDLNDRYSLALYQRKMLSTQWSRNKLRHDLNYVAWADTATKISRYFFGQSKFLQARYHLAAASCILEKYLKILKAKGSRENIAVEYEHYDAQLAKVAMCWAEYGIALLGKSKERLLKRDEEKDEDSTSTEIPDNLRFVDLEPELGLITNKITNMYLLNKNDAGPVMLNVRKWLDKAKQYFTFETNKWYYGDIVEQLSNAYKYLLFFEDDEDRQAEIHKQRIVILEEINEKFYRNKGEGRKIWLDLAETYSTIVDLEVNRLSRNSIQYYQTYQESLKESKKIDFLNNCLHLELDSYFRVGTLYCKIISSDIQQKIENTQKSLEAYSVIVDYCNDNPEKQKELEKWDIVKLSKKYVTSLPLTLDKFKQQQKDQ